MAAKDFWTVVLILLGFGLVSALLQSWELIYFITFLTAASETASLGEISFFFIGLIGLVVFYIMAIAGFIGWWKKKRFGYYLVLFMAGFGAMFAQPFTTVITMGFGGLILSLIVLIFTLALFAVTVFLIFKSRQVFGIVEKRNLIIVLAAAVVLGLLAGTGLILAPSSDIFSGLAVLPCRTTVLDGNFSEMCLQLEDVGTGYTILYQENSLGEKSGITFETEDDIERVGCEILLESILNLPATDKGLGSYKASVEGWKDDYQIEEMAVEDFDQFGVKGFNYSIKRKDSDPRFERSLRFYFENVWVVITIFSKEEMPQKQRIVNYAETVLKRLKENTKKQQC